MPERRVFIGINCHHEELSKHLTDHLIKTYRFKELDLSSLILDKTEKYLEAYHVKINPTANLISLMKENYDLSGFDGHVVLQRLTCEYDLKMFTQMNPTYKVVGIRVIVNNDTKGLIEIRPTEYDVIDIQPENGPDLEQTTTSLDILLLNFLIPHMEISSNGSGEVSSSS